MVTDDVSGLAELLSTNDVLREHLLRTHVARPDGRCRGCSSQGSLAERWPCSLSRAAERGLRLRRAQNGSTSASSA